MVTTLLALMYSLQAAAEALTSLVSSPSALCEACCSRADGVIVLFEEGFLSIIPAACFLLLTPLRVIHLVKRKIKVRPTSLHTAKLVRIPILHVLKSLLITEGSNLRLCIPATRCASSVVDTLILRDSSLHCFGSR